MEERLVDLNGLSEILNISTRTIRRIIKDDHSFPQPIKFGERMTRWRYSDIMSWIESKTIDGKS